MFELCSVLENYSLSGQGVVCMFIRIFSYGVSNLLEFEATYPLYSQKGD